MTTSAWILALVALLGVACSGGAPRANPLLSGLQQPLPDGVREGCELAEVKCTRCHTIDRPLRARVKNPSHWVHYVRRMRMQPGSGIGSADQQPIIRCLVYRSFGAEGLAEIDGEAAK